VAVEMLEWMPGGTVRVAEVTENQFGENSDAECLQIAYGFEAEQVGHEPVPEQHDKCAEDGGKEKRQKDAAEYKTEQPENIPAGMPFKMVEMMFHSQCPFLK
jgi:hypothetical protein